jgi:small nuclear ribonucleoprotein (snRNP)-like protein
MSDVASMRAFNRELAAVVGASVEVKLKSGEVYSGTIRGIDKESLSIVLAEVHTEEDKNIPKMFIYGDSIASFSLSEKEISLEGLARELESSFPPGGVRYYPDTAVIVVMNKVRITPEGVEGSGPLYERVKSIADEWLEDHGLKQ